MIDSQRNTNTDPHKISTTGKIIAIIGIALLPILTQPSKALADIAYSKIELPTNTKFYKLKSGDVIAYDPINNRLSMANNDFIFSELEILSRKSFVTGGIDNHFFSAKIPNTMVIISIELGEENRYNGEIMEEIKHDNNVNFIKLQDKFEIAHKFILPDGNILEIDLKQKGDIFNIKSYKLYIGTPGNMRQITLEHVSRYDSDGRIKYITSKGMLITKGKYNNPTWNHQPIREIK